MKQATGKNRVQLVSLKRKNERQSKGKRAVQCGPESDAGIKGLFDLLGFLERPRDYRPIATYRLS